MTLIILLSSWYILRAPIHNNISVDEFVNCIYTEICNYLSLSLAFVIIVFSRSSSRMNSSTQQQQQQQQEQQQQDQQQQHNLIGYTNGGSRSSRTTNSNQATCDQATQTPNSISREKRKCKMKSLKLSFNNVAPPALNLNLR